MDRGVWSGCIRGVAERAGHDLVTKQQQRMGHTRLGSGGRGVGVRGRGQICRCALPPGSQKGAAHSALPLVPASGCPGGGGERGARDNGSYFYNLHARTLQSRTDPKENRGKNFRLGTPQTLINPCSCSL